MANIVLPLVNILSKVNDNTNVLIEQDGAIQRINVNKIAEIDSTKLFVTIDTQAMISSHSSIEIYAAIQTGKTVIISEQGAVYTVSEISEDKISIFIELTEFEILFYDIDINKTVTLKNTITTATIPYSGSTINGNILSVVDEKPTWTKPTNGIAIQTEAPENIDVLWLDTDDNSVDFGGNMEDGFSPIAKVEQIEAGAVISITDKDGTTTATITNGKDGKDYVLTDVDKTEITETVKAEVPLVKVAEQPTFVNSVDEMTDPSKPYVLLTDGCFYTYKEVEQSEYTFTADDFVATGVESNGALSSGSSTRIATTKLWDLNDGAISVDCPEPYQYFVYYYTEEKESSYIGKTSWKSGNIDNVLNDTIGSGTSDGAKYCRISLRDKNSTTSLTGRIDEFLSHITIAQDRSSAEPVYKWVNTGLFYNQPADYEDRIIALEKALEVIENGSY